MFKKTIYLTLSILLIALAPATSHAEIKLPAIFGDHMVLQQMSDAPIWGTATPGRTVTVIPSWAKKSYSIKADEKGNWKMSVKTPSAGGPYEISVSDGKAVFLRDVLIGEVWICSGQSNMEMKMKGYRNQPVLGSNEAIATSADPAIRLFTVKHKTSLIPQTDFEGEWKECLPENVAEFSATAWFFGSMIRKALGVPVGLVCSAWGGTRIEPWTSAAGLAKFDFVKLPGQEQTDNLSPQTPTVLYNAMIHPMAGFALRGAIWYQGEANRNEPEQYLKLMPGLIEDWRNIWGIGDFPFYFVQIAPYDYGFSGQNSAFLREAQLKASTLLPHSGMACVLDKGEKDCIHPANKKAAGERLAYLALADAYGKKGFEYSGPVFREMKTEGNLIHLTFDHAGNGLTTYGKEITTFKVAGENQRFYPARAIITGSGITLYSPITNPVAVRYAFDDFVVGELFNTEGLPASSFRTDDWEK
jgi:sialate O-acetylesterase